jgi:hypothetical protein
MPLDWQVFFGDTRGIDAKSIRQQIRQFFVPKTRNPVCRVPPADALTNQQFRPVPARVGRAARLKHSLSRALSTFAPIVPPH